MVDVVGRSHDLLLFSDGDDAVVIDTRDSTVVNKGKAGEFISTSTWDPVEPAWLKPCWSDLARAELTTLNVLVAAANNERKYTIPKAVQAEAKRGLAWRGMLGRGGTGVAMNTAHKLANGGQIDIKRVRHMSRYLSRHEADKLSLGWAQSEPTFPSSSRINWSLFGGNVGLRWAKSIIAQADANSISAGAYVVQPLDPFHDANAVFVAKASEDDPFEMTALYVVLGDDNVFRWDSGDWYPVDEEDEWDEADSQFVELDPDTALMLSGMLDEQPYGPISLFSINHDEAELAWNALPGIDWEMIDRVMVAAGTPGGPVKPSGSGDGYYSPEERSKNATRQVRDGTGRFVKVGYHGINPQNRAVTIVGVSEKGDGQITVVDDKTGERFNMLPKDFRAGLAPPTNETITPVDLSKILGQPRATATTPKAWLPSLLPPMDSANIQKVINNYRQQILDERAANAKKFPGGQPQFPGPARARAQKGTAKKRGKVASGVSFAELADLSGGAPMTPDNSDVKPVYLAIVADDDVQAVLDLVALVPSSATNPEPTTYRRENAQWVSAPDILTDLNSPTPPPVVALDEPTFQDTLAQVDASTVQQEQAQAQPAQPVTASLGDMMTPIWGPTGEILSLIAAGGADRNRGDAEKLRRYWVHGEGAAKIKWGTPGDFNRCVHHLEKHMPGRAQGYCNLRHKEAIGMYPATHAKRLHGHAALGIETSTPPVVVNDPQPGDQITCPGCGDDVMFDEMDGFQRLDGSVSHDDYTTHSDYILIIPAEDETWEPPEDIKGIMQGYDPMHEDDGYGVQAAAGVDTHPAAAERLRLYWTVGKGGAKIRWNTPGDWRRCVKHLEKYLGPRAKGYCQLRHHEVTGTWTGDKNNVGRGR